MFGHFHPCVENPQVLDNALDGAYKNYLTPLEKALKADGLESAATSTEKELRNKIREGFLNDLSKTEGAISFDLAQSVFARAMPDRILLQRNIDSDAQVVSAVKLLKEKDTVKNLLSGPPNFVTTTDSSIRASSF